MSRSIDKVSADLFLEAEISTKEEWLTIRPCPERQIGIHLCRIAQAPIGLDERRDRSLRSVDVVAVGLYRP